MKVHQFDKMIENGTILLALLPLNATPKSPPVQDTYLDTKGEEVYLCLSPP